MLNFIHNYKTDLVNPSHQKEKGYARQNSTSHTIQSVNDFVTKSAFQDLVCNEII